MTAPLQPPPASILAAALKVAHWADGYVHMDDNDRSCDKALVEAVVGELG